MSDVIGFVIDISSFVSVSYFFFFKQKSAYELLRSLVGSDMCIRDSGVQVGSGWPAASTPLVGKTDAAVGDGGSASTAGVGEAGGGSCSPAAIFIGLSLIHI